MSPHILKMKFSLSDIGANAYAWLGTIVSWGTDIHQADVEFCLRVLMTISAIAVSVVTVYYKIKNNGKSQ